MNTSDRPVILLQPQGLQIPTGIDALESFRTWACSDGFPEDGRIDWVCGVMEVDMSPGDLNTHGNPKSAIAGRLFMLIQDPGRGAVYIDRARLSSVPADLSAEPDVVVLLIETVEKGLARLVPKASREKGRFIEIEGRVDLICEVVSDSSVEKDTRRLQAAYYEAGVPEYWLVDARKTSLRFDLHVRGESAYEVVRPDRSGFRPSPLLGLGVRLVREKEAAGLVFHRLEVR